MAKTAYDRPMPLLIAMKGHPATGKSNVAACLAQRLRCPLIDKDDVKDHLLDTERANERAYAIMWQIVAVQLALRLSVIAVSPLSYPESYAAAQELAAKHRAHLLVVETQIEDGEWARRLNARGAGYSEHKISGWEAMQEMLRQYNGCWQYAIAPAQHVVLDTAQPLRALIDQIMQRVETLHNAAAAQ